MSWEPCCILPREAARTARCCRLGLTATAGCYRHMSALRKGAVHWARPGPEQLWRQPPTPFGSSPPCALAGVTPPVRAAFLPSSAAVWLLKSIIKTHRSGKHPAALNLYFTPRSPFFRIFPHSGMDLLTLRVPT